MPETAPDYGSPKNNCRTVTAIGEGGGAGIGGALGENLVKGSITINGGDVSAAGVENIGWNRENISSTEQGSAGIGAGSHTAAGGDLSIPITITGGHVRATGVSGAAGIGAGYRGYGFGRKLGRACS